MKLMRRILILTLIVSVCWFFFPKLLLAQQTQLFVKTATEKGITELLPEFVATSEEEIPGAEKEGKISGKAILLGVLGLVVVGGLAAAGMGGGGGGGSGNGNGDGGSVSVS